MGAIPDKKYPNLTCKVRVKTNKQHTYLCWHLLRYHEDWNWLMPVVEKIESLEYFVKIGTKCCSISKENKDDSTFVKSVFGKNKLENIYNCVSSFVKYFK